MISRYVGAVLAAASFLVSFAASAEEAAAPLTAEDRLLQAVQSAADAARSAKEAAEASRKAAEAIGAVKPPEAPPKVDAPPQPAAPPASPWTFQIAANLLSVTGNATAISGKLAGRVEGRWTDWAVLAKADAAYGQAVPATGGPASVTALNASGILKGDRKLTEAISAYLSGGAATDHVASIEFQAFGEAGMTVVWLETKEADYVKARVRTDLGFRYTREGNFQYYPTPLAIGSKDIFAPRAAGSFLYALSKTSLVTEDLEVLPDIINPKNVRAISNTALIVELIKGIAVQVTLKVRFIGVPAPGATTTDTELGAGLSWTF